MSTTQSKRTANVVLRDVGGGGDLTPGTHRPLDLIADSLGILARNWASSRDETVSLLAHLAGRMARAAGSEIGLVVYDERTPTDAVEAAGIVMAEMIEGAVAEGDEHRVVRQIQVVMGKFQHAVSRGGDR